MVDTITSTDKNYEKIEKLSDREISMIIREAKRMGQKLSDKKLAQLRTEAKRDLKMQLKIIIIECGIANVDDFKTEFGLKSSIVHDRPEQQMATMGDVAVIVPGVKKGKKPLEEPVTTLQQMKPETIVIEKDDVSKKTEPDDDEPEPGPAPMPYPLPPVPEAKTETQTVMVMEPEPNMDSTIVDFISGNGFKENVPKPIQRIYDAIVFRNETKCDAYGRPIVAVRWHEGKAFFDKYEVLYDERFQEFMEKEVHERSKLDSTYIPMVLTDILGPKELLAEPQMEGILEKRRLREESAFVIETISLTKQIFLMTNEERHARKRITASEKFMRDLEKKPGKRGMWKVAPAKVFNNPKFGAPRIEIIPLEQLESFDEAKEAERREFWFGSRKKVVDIMVRVIPPNARNKHPRIRITSDDIDPTEWTILDGRFFEDHMDKEEVKGGWRAQISGSNRRDHITFITPVCRLKVAREEEFLDEQLEKMKKGDKIEIV